MKPMPVEVALDALAERVAEPVVRLARDGRVLFANAAFARDFGPAPAYLSELAANGAMIEGAAVNIIKSCGGNLGAKLALELPSFVQRLAKLQQLTAQQLIAHPVS